MKTKIYKIFALIISICSTVSALNYNIPEAVAIPQIEGILSSGEWNDALEIQMSYPDIITPPEEGALIVGTSPTASDSSAVWYIKWDADYLYIACVAYDNSMEWVRNFGQAYSGQDTVQMCLNLFNDPQSVFYQEAAIYDFVPQTADNYGADVYRHNLDGLAADISIAGTVETDRYIIEVALPWAAHSGDYTSASAGDRHGFGLLIHDLDGGTTKNLMTDFGSGTNVISQPAQWNTITLVKQNGCGEHGIFQGDINQDCYVNIADFAELASQWIHCTDPANTECE